MGSFVLVRSIVTRNVLWRSCQIQGCPQRKECNGNVSKEMILLQGILQKFGGNVAKNECQEPKINVEGSVMALWVLLPFHKNESVINTFLSDAVEFIKASAWGNGHGDAPRRNRIESTVFL